ncbi:hypothetical protein [Nocardioides mesophilus]|uniref:LPXTG cell wall anchor domain-containing protein n=1 Tax=Nocardioides mesophilus TaxID=433659 RepID=A0A7G9R9J8_9ACTN|nr:hypothetical protein [Nocardioides mesophilus]QNN52273.1 hypothetical protein H9L09_17575 [Nocardioides mesophilus]
MTSRPLVRSLGVGLASAVAALALAGPAAAMNLPDPGTLGGPPTAPADPPAAPGPSDPWTEVSAAVLGAILLAGAGATAINGSRERRQADSRLSASTTTARSVVGHIGGSEARRKLP